MAKKNTSKPCPGCKQPSPRKNKNGYPMAWRPLDSVCETCKQRLYLAAFILEEIEVIKALKVKP